jgi:hypothetical protein
MAISVGHVTTGLCLAMLNNWAREMKMLMGEVRATGTDFEIQNRSFFLSLDFLENIQRNGGTKLSKVKQVAN